VLLASLGTVSSAHAAPSADLLTGSRVSAGLNTTATAASGSTLYLGGDIPSIGYRTAGLAATDVSTGEVDLEVPELQGRPEQSIASADRVVPDGKGGVYSLGVGTTTGTTSSGATAGGVTTTTGWLHFGADGRPDKALADRLKEADGSPADLRDVAVAADGTTYLSGTFTTVGGTARAGLAAVAANGELTPWAPVVAGGPVAGLTVLGGNVLLVGSNTDNQAFKTVGGQARDGLALVSGADGAVRAWRPTGLDQTAARRDVTGDANAVYLLDADGRTVRAVTLAGTGTARDLDLAPDDANQTITQLELEDGTLYVGGQFTSIGAQPTQPERRGLAEIDPDTGNATAWHPATNNGVGGALEVTADAVYVGGDSNMGDACGAAYRRTDASRTGWRPSLTTTNASCYLGTTTSLAVSGNRVWAAGGGLRQANTESRLGFAAVDLATDRILPWAPNMDDTYQLSVRDMEVSPDGETVYLASEYVFSLNGEPRKHIGAVAAEGAANTPDDVSPFDPAPDQPVSTLAFSADGATLYLGGDFTTLNDADVPYLAAVSPETGAPTAWRPAPDAAVDELEVSPAGTLYAAGQFTKMGSVARRNLAAFGATPGAPTAWDPQLTGTAGEEPAAQDLAIGEGVVYVAGAFDGTIGGQTRSGVAALDPTTGDATAWDAGVNGSVRTVSTASDGTVYLAGRLVGGGRGAFTTVQGRARPASIASVTAAGKVTRWSPGTPTTPGALPFLFGPDARSAEFREVDGKLVLPVIASEYGSQGLPLQGFAAFAPGTAAPSAQIPAQPPVIVGKGSIEEVLQCRPGSYRGDGPLFRSYVWLVDGAVADGQTGATYRVREADTDKEIVCRETVENAEGELVTSSAPVRAAVVLAVNDGPPEVAGTPQPGQTLTCAEGQWSARVAGYTYRWLRNGAAVGGATGRTFAVSAGDVGASIACEVVATNAAGASKPALSAGRTVVPAPGGGDNPGPGNPGPNDPPPNNPPPNNPPPNNPGPPTKPTQPPAPGPKVSVAAKAVGGKGRKITLTVSPSAAGRVTVSASTGSGKKRVVVGSGSATAKKAGALTVTVKPSSKGKKALKAGRTVKVTFKVTFTGADGQKVSVSKTIKVKIKR
jgi:hypothetical protein